MKKTVILFLVVLCALPVSGQEKTRRTFSLKRKPKVEQPASRYSDEYLDTVNVRKKLELNDYSMFGVEYGVSRNSQLFTPKFNSQPVFFPEFFGVTYTRYGKLIGSPVVGFQVGAFYGHEGYELKVREENGLIRYQQILNATKVEMDYAEGAFMAVGHYDMPHFKLLLNIGPYAGYRLSLHRSSALAQYGITVEIDPALVDNFADFEKRFDYGLHGGAGFGVIFDPFEFQVNLRVRYSWSSLWEPNYNSEYYYRYAYPFDFMLTGGLHFHITRRYGKTRAMLRREAREIVEQMHNPEQ